MAGWYSAQVATSIYESGGYLASNPDWHEADAEFKAARVRQILLQNGLHPNSICDVGCGTGGVLRSLRDMGFGGARLIGCDISPQALARAEGIETFLGTVEDAPHSDVAMALDVFEHVDDYMGFLRSMTRIAPVQVYHIPLDISLLAMLRGTMVKHRATLGHIHVFTAGTALAALRETGHEVLAVNYACGPAEQPKSWKQSIAAWPRITGLLWAPRFASALLDGYSMMVLCRRA